MNKKIKYIISGNFGDGTIALIQWAHENQLTDVTLVNVVTGWEDITWNSRVEKGKQLAKNYGFSTETLYSNPDFITLMKERGEFPGQKFQWCAGILKGLPLLEWMDKVDPGCEATVILPKRREGARVNLFLKEIVDESEHHGDRKLWHPLWNQSTQDFIALIERAGFEYLNHRSLECSPCVNSTFGDLHHMASETILKTKTLEEAIGKPFFSPDNYDGEKGIEAVVKWVRKHPKDHEKEEYQLGCGTPFGCGDV